MVYDIINATADDLPEIYRLFDQAILFQQQRGYTGWNTYDQEYIQSDVRNGLLYKLISQKNILCIFSVAFTDPLIWRDKEKGDALYLHRLVLNQVFKGAKVFEKVLNWAIGFALERSIQYIRMDTWADNEKLIAYYQSHGFAFVENFTTGDTKDLPLQHRNLRVALLELTVHSHV